MGRQNEALVVMTIRSISEQYLPIIFPYRLMSNDA